MLTGCQFSIFDMAFGKSMNHFVKEALSNPILGESLECQKICQKTRQLQFALKIIAGLGMFFAATGICAPVLLILARRGFVVLSKWTIENLALAPAYMSAACLVSFLGWVALKIEISRRLVQSLLNSTLVSSEAVQNQVCTLLEKHPFRISDFNLEGAVITAPLLRKQLPSLTSVQRLILSADGLTAADLNQIKLKCPHLYHLSLHGTLNIAESDYSLFETFTQLKDLEIQNGVHLGCEGFKSICGLANQSLNRLALSAPNLDAYAIQLLAASNKPYLSILEIYTLYIKAGHLETLTEKNFPALCHIGFRIDSAEEEEKIQQLKKRLGVEWTYKIDMQKKRCEVYYVEPDSDDEEI